MNAPLARYLTHFDQTPSPVSIEAEPVPSVVYLRLTPDELDAQLDTARCEAAGFATARHQIELSELSERLRREGAEALDAARALWVSEEGERLTAKIDSGIKALEEALCEHACNVLRPWLRETAAQRAREAFRAALASILDEADHKALLVQGPKDLIDAIRSGNPKHRGIELTESEGLDALLVADGTRVRTRMAEALSIMQDA